MSDLVTLDDIVAAQQRIAGVAVRTPLLPAPWAGDLHLKAESLQPTGAFKIRGAYNAIAALVPEVRGRGVLTHSSGNHAQAIAYAAAQLGVPAVVVMPVGSAEIKIAATRGYGADVVLVPPEQRESRAAELQQDHGYVLVPPFDHRDVIAGQGTVGLEIVEDLPDVDTVLVPISGGGLVSGIAVAVKSLKPEAKVIAVEPELAGDAYESFRSGDRVVWTAERTFRTIADGLRVTVVGQLPWQHIQEFVDDVVTVSEDQIRNAVRLLAQRSRLVAEPSGAVSTAAALSRSDAIPGESRVAIVSGGNVDLAAYAAILAG